MTRRSWVRAAVWKELTHELRGLKPEPVIAPRGIEQLLQELRKMVKSGLIKAGVLKA